MSAGDVKHDYHLVNPSPWPLVGSLAACVMAVGGVIAMKGLFGLPKGNLAVFIGGLAGVILTMAVWWRDVTIEANQGDHTPVVSIGLRYGMIMFIASEVMFFVAWFWIFFEMALFNEFRTQSGLEEVPVTWAHHALQTGDRRAAKIGLLLTIILGAIFTAVQVYEYKHILDHNYFFGGEGAENSGLYGSAFFMATGFHGFHVLIGTIFLIVCLARLMGSGFTTKQHFAFEAVAWYWHFVDVVWLFLFAFIYVVFGASAGH